MEVSPSFYTDTLKRRKSMIEAALELCLPENSFNPLISGMRYALINGGKRIRPMLVLEGACLAGHPEELVLPLACAVEMIHAYSLVHDDLPAMDNDLWRRGNPTCHVQFGEAQAILIGDALLTEAFGILATSAQNFSASAPTVLQVIRELSQAAGYQGMILGQTLDLAAEKQTISTVELENIHRHKTGALLTAALRSGALLGGMEAKSLDDLTRFSEQLGLLFQITDDILDVVASADILGRAAGSDQKNQKSTYVSLYGLDGAKRQADQCLATALEILASFSKPTHFLATMTRNIHSRCD